MSIILKCRKDRVRCKMRMLRTVFTVMGRMHNGQAQAGDSRCYPSKVGSNNLTSFYYLHASHYRYSWKHWDKNLINQNQYPNAECRDSNNKMIYKNIQREYSLLLGGNICRLQNDQRTWKLDFQSKPKLFSLQEEETSLQKLNLSDCKLKTDINNVINALGSNQCLQVNIYESHLQIRL